HHHARHCRGEELMNAFANIKTITKRELVAYFASPPGTGATGNTRRRGCGAFGVHHDFCVPAAVISPATETETRERCGGRQNFSRTGGPRRDEAETCRACVSHHRGRDSVFDCDVVVW